ncbi:MAG: hypothetical protein IJ410_05725 [Oscillospiraceae bacterium]|nr:hypothetical protein [Oscillospiraceae bacterium]
MLYSVAYDRSAEYLMIDTLFTEPVFLLLVLLIPAGVYLIKKDIFHAKLIGTMSVMAGIIFILSRFLYNI